jgi:TetR/AcrR family transcriptional repressor of nem operon
MRYKEYNVNSVLEKSIDLFWQKGFNGCSVNEIVEKTTVNRFSLYHEFENKQGILYATLSLYRKRYCDEKLKILESSGGIVSNIKNFYLSFLNDEENNMGCYIIHIGTELADSDPRVKTCVDEYLSEIEELFVQLLNKHNYETEDAKLRARHLLGLYCTTMSFCLIHTPAEREKYALNGIKLILTKNGKNTK